MRLVVQRVSSAAVAVAGERIAGIGAGLLVLAGVGVAGLDTPRPNLEDLFVGLTGEGFDVDG